MFETFTENIYFLLEPWKPFVAVLYSYSPLIIIIWIMLRYQGRERKKSFLAYKQEQEKKRIEKENVLDNIAPEDLMSFADIQILLGLQRSATTERIKEAGLTSWKFGGKGTPLYLRKDVMKAFEKEK
jgi:hypothetical protein